MTRLPASLGLVRAEVCQASLEPVGPVIEAEFPVAPDGGFVAALGRLMPLGPGVQVGEFGSQPGGEEPGSAFRKPLEASHRRCELGPGFDGFVPGEGQFGKALPELGCREDIIGLPPGAHPVAFCGIEASRIKAQLPEEFVGPSAFPTREELGGGFEVAFGKLLIVPGQGHLCGPILRLGSGIASVPKAVDGPFGEALGLREVLPSTEPGEFEERQTPAQAVPEGSEEGGRFPKAFEGPRRVGLPEENRFVVEFARQRHMQTNGMGNKTLTRGPQMRSKGRGSRLSDLRCLQGVTEWSRSDDALRC